MENHALMDRKNGYHIASFQLWSTSLELFSLDDSCEELMIAGCQRFPAIRKSAFQWCPSFSRFMAKLLVTWL
jgi:hypothetical protein